MTADLEQGQANGGTTQPETQPAQNGGNATFTQEQLDRIIGERLERAKKTIVSDFLKGLGVDSQDALKSVISAHQSQQDALKTEAQRWEEKLTAAEQARIELQSKWEAADKRAAELESKWRTDRRDAALTRALTDAKAEDVDDLLLLLSAKHSDLVSATLKEDGTLDNKAVEALVAKAKEVYGKHFARVPGSPSNRNGKSPDTDKERMKKVFGETPIVKL